LDQVNLDGASNPFQYLFVPTIPDMPLDEEWLNQLATPNVNLAARANTLQLAQDEGLKVFSAHEPQAAAEFLLKNGFVVLIDVLTGTALQKMQQVSGELVQEVVRKRPEGSRGDQRWTMGMTTDHVQYGQACLEPASNIFLCDVLAHFWNSTKFTLLCSGGDFSLPGAGMQNMHADLPQRDKIHEVFCYPRYIEATTPPTLKVYFALADLNEETGPPVFVPGSHLRYAYCNVPQADPEGSKRAFCPAGSAIVMDLRIWHHGTPNRSQLARPMTSLHYAAPWYNEAVLTKASPYWMYHRGSVSREQLLQMPQRLRQLCCNLVYQQCQQCNCPADINKPSEGWYKWSWYCESCNDEWRKSHTSESSSRTFSQRKPNDTPYAKRLLLICIGIALFKNIRRTTIAPSFRCILHYISRKQRSSAAP